MPPSADQLLARPGLQLLEERVVAVVVVLDDLERPPALDDGPSDELLVDAVRDLRVPGLAQQVDGVAQSEVTHPGEPVKRIQVAAGVLDHLERLGQLAERFDGLVGRTLRTTVFGGWSLHPATVGPAADVRVALSPRVTRR